MTGNTMQQQSDSYPVELYSTMPQAWCFAMPFQHWWEED